MFLDAERLPLPYFSTSTVELEPIPYFCLCCSCSDVADFLGALTEVPFFPVVLQVVFLFTGGLEDDDLRPRLLPRVEAAVPPSFVLLSVGLGGLFHKMAYFLCPR